MTFALGQRVTVRSAHVYDGEVVLVVPAMRNPFIEIRRSLGRVRGLRIPKERSGYLPLREIESYIVKRVNDKGHVAYHWPPNNAMERADG